MTEPHTFVTLNVQRASRKRTDRQVAWLLDGATADVLVLTELPAHGEHAALLAKAGYAVQVDDAPQGLACMVASRQGELKRNRLIFDELGTRIVHVGLEAWPSTRVSEVLGLYIPSRGPRGRRNFDKRRAQTFVQERVSRLGDQAVVLGDLNVVERGHRPTYRHFGEWEYSFYEAFGDVGLVDAYRHLHPQSSHDHSWFGRSGSGYRFDHAFVGQGLVGSLRACQYDASPIEAGLSDHAALVMRIAPSEPEV